MELTQIKGSMFGYKKADVVQYISELNELHTAEIQNREADLDELKKSSEAEITALKEENIQLSSKVEKLSEQLNSVVAELNSTLSALDNLKTEHNTLLDETSELRERSEFISTAIIKAEKCAGILINEARSNAQEMVDNAQKKVELEKDRWSFDWICRSCSDGYRRKSQRPCRKIFSSGRRGCSCRCPYVSFGRLPDQTLLRKC